MKIKLVFIVIISILLAGVIGFFTWWGINNYSKVKDGISGTAIYTYVDLEKAKMEGYIEGANAIETLEENYNKLKEEIEDYKQKYLDEHEIRLQLEEELEQIRENTNE